MALAAQRPRRGGLRRGEGRAGWLFVAPAVIITAVFLAIPILLALWVSVSDWNGFQSPLNPRVNFVGLENYAAITTEEGLDQRNFGTAVRNMPGPSSGEYRGPGRTSLVRRDPIGVVAQIAP